MDREKETAKELCRHFIKTTGYDRLYCPHCSEENIPCGFATNIVKIVKQSIIPDCAVVINKDELEALRNDLINAECNLNHVTLQLEEERKETAREILRKAEKKARFVDGGHYGKDRYELDLDDLKTIIKKDFGVEVDNG